MDLFAASNVTVLMSGGFWCVVCYQRSFCSNPFWLEVTYGLMSCYCNGSTYALAIIPLGCQYQLDLTPPLLYDVTCWHRYMHDSNMLETVTKVDGTSSQHWVFPSNVTGPMSHSVTLAVRERVRYTVGAEPASLTTG
jgi:hypothetical protein